ncbi:MAG TPA: hypothetical protein V6C85_31135 [Allocoleopsis sp.]
MASKNDYESALYQTGKTAAEFLTEILKKKEGELTKEEELKINIALKLLAMIHEAAQPSDVKLHS